MNPFHQPRKTFADYVAIAICPLLIMVLVGTLAYFLLEVGYDGRYSSRVRWAMFWIVIAMVLISRISIEQGVAHANAYGLLMAVAAGAMIWRFIQPPYVAWALLAGVWWTASKLTWDSTLIDDDADASGEGLLQAGGLQSGGETSAPAPTRQQKRRASWLSRFERNASKSGRAHAPGVWVVWFSLAALLVFGFGQTMISRDDPERRAYGFQLLWVFIAAALGLLLLTSFLGLRRYLRQRQLQMPSGVAVTWVSLGALLAVAILALSLVLPRPDGFYTLGDLAGPMETAIRNASKYALGGGESGEGDGRRTGTSEEGKSGEQGETGEGGGEKGEGKTGKGDGPGDPKPGEGGKESGKDGKTTGGDVDGQSSSQMQQAASQENAPSDWWKWIVAALIAAALLALAWWKRKAIAAWLRSVLDWWRAFWAALRRRPAPQRGVMVPERPPRPFRDYRDPFEDGDPADATAALALTFEALCAWGREHGLPRRTDDTPVEYASGLGFTAPDLGENLRAVALLYARAAYGGVEITVEELAPARTLWRQMLESADAPLLSTVSDS